VAEETERTKRRGLNLGHELLCGFALGMLIETGYSGGEGLQPDDAMDVIELTDHTG